MLRKQSFVMVAVAFALLAGGFLLALNLAGTQSSSTVVTYTYSIVNTYIHDANAFTEGLLYEDDVLYESTGLYGSSTLRIVNLQNGSVLQEVKLPAEFFGEGITLVNGKILQLTWREQTGFIYDPTTLTLEGNFSYATEGWGITFDGNRLIMSDGTSNLYFLDPANYQLIGQIQVRDGNFSVVNLNELEYVKGDVYANIWQQQKIAIINPQTGQVKAYIDLSGIGTSIDMSGQNVLNGIAYDAQNDRLYVTGKNWSHLFEIKLVSK